MCTQPFRFWLLAAERTWAKSCSADHLVAQKMETAISPARRKKKESKMKRVQKKNPKHQNQPKTANHHFSVTMKFSCIKKEQYKDGRQRFRHPLSLSVQRITTKLALVYEEAGHSKSGTRLYQINSIQKKTKRYKALEWHLKKCRIDMMHCSVSLSPGYHDFRIFDSTIKQLCSSQTKTQKPHAEAVELTDENTN